MQFSIIGFQRSAVSANENVRYGNSEQLCYELLMKVGQHVPEVMVVSSAKSFMVLCSWHNEAQYATAIREVCRWGQLAEVDFPPVFFHYSGLSAWASLRHAANTCMDNSGLQSFTDGFELASHCGMVGPTLSQAYERVCDILEPAEAV